MFLEVLAFGLLLHCGFCLDLETFYLYTRDVNSRPECDQQKTIFIQGLSNREEWALRMLDAYGHIPHGVTQGNSMDMGMFDQCLNISETIDAVKIRGKYCYAGLALPLSNISLDIQQPVQQISKSVIKSVQRALSLKVEDSEVSAPEIVLLAACIPDTCLPSDLFGQLGVDIACQTRDGSKLEGGDIACLTFFAVIALLVTTSTIYDVYLQKLSKESAHSALLAFSIYTNGKKILKTTDDSGQILFFNGMRVLSMFWVIMGHRYQLLESQVPNLEEAKAWTRKWYAVYLIMAPLAVDTFLFISGALLAYTFLKTMRKPNRKFNILLYYLHRYLRLTPAVAVLYFFTVTLVDNVQDGPMHPLIVDALKTPCLSSNWWSFFLYVQNYVATDNQCLNHTWYLSVDMQFYIISPFLLLPIAYFGKRLTYLVIPFLVVIVMTYNILIFYFYDIVIWSTDYMNLFYYTSHTRLPQWFIGLIFGAFILDYQANSIRYQIRNKLIVLAIWGLETAIVAFIFFYQDDVTYNPTTLKSAFFIPLQKILWALSLSWISYACMSGNAGFINSFLSLPIFQVLTRITYSTYLVHLVILLLHVGYSRAPPYFTDYEALRVSISDICICYAVGALWTLAFESPVIVLEQFIFKRDGAKKRREESKNYNSNSAISNEKISNLNTLPDASMQV